jgi:hypothetical protein
VASPSSVDQIWSKGGTLSAVTRLITFWYITWQMTHRNKIIASHN